MFARVAPEVGAGFQRMREGWLDIEPRPGKVPGLGYQSYFAASRMPYIYMSAVGTDDDVLVMRHEMGHALHTLRTQERWPLLMHMSDRPEMNELASQALEFLTLPYLEKAEGGFYDAEDAQRSRGALLVRALELLVWACRLDAIQHFIYTHPGLQDGTGPTAAEIDAEWVRLAQRFDAGVDFTGYERSLERGWQYFHLFRIPFYYIEYAIAYLGALQVWERAREDQAAALADYLEALSLGGTKPLDELYRAAGVSFEFDHATVARLTEMVMRELGDEA
jgi:oligoendopeptidase F